MSSTGNIKNQNQNLNQYLSIGVDGTLDCSVDFTGGVINCDTLNATTENIVNRNNYDVTGYVHCDGDIVSNYGTDDYSLNTVAANQLTDESNIATNTSNIATNTTDISALQTKTQLQSANSGATTFTQRLVSQGTTGTNYILLDPNGDYSSGRVGLNVGHGVNGLIYTDEVSTDTLSINGGLTTIYDTSSNVIIGMNPNNTGEALVVNGTITCDYIQTTGSSSVPLEVKDSGSNTVFSVDDAGVITATKIILVNSDAQIDGATGDASFVGLSADSGSFQGNIDMNSNKIVNLADGTVSSDAANYGQITGLSSVYQPLSTNLTTYSSKTPPTGDVVGTSDTQTLTNKTIDGGSNTISNIDLATQVTGNLSVNNLNSGTSASSSTFWRGDGTWAAAGGGSISNRARAFYSGTASNVTGDGTNYVLVGNLVSPAGYGWNPNSEYNTSTGVFTAAASGYYICCANIAVISLNSSHNYLSVYMTGTYSYGQPIYTIDPHNITTGGAIYISITSPTIYLGAGETVALNLYVSGSTKTVGVQSSSIISFTRVQ